MNQGETLNRVRMMLGLTRREASRKCGVTEKTYARWEKRKDGHLEKFLMVLRQLGVTAEIVRECKINIPEFGEMRIRMGEL